MGSKFEYEGHHLNLVGVLETMSKKLTMIDGKQHQQLKLAKAMIFALKEVIGSNGYPRQQSNWCIKGLDLRQGTRRSNNT